MIKTFIKNSSLVLGSNILSKLVNFITLGFLARILGPEQLGFYNAIQNSGNYINMMSSFGSSIVIQRVGARIKELGKEVVSTMFSTSFTLYLVINFVLAVFIAVFPEIFFDLLLDKKGNVEFVYLISILVILNAMVQVPIYLMLGLEQFRQYALRNFLISVITLLTSVILVLILPDNTYAVYLALIISMILNVGLTGVVFYQIIRQYDLSIRLTLQWTSIKEMISDGFLYYFGNTFLGAIVGIVVISLFYKHLSSEEYGYTRIGNSFSMLLAIVPSAIQPVTISHLSGNQLSSQRIKSFQTRFIPFLSALLFVSIVLNLDLVLGLCFGKQYIGAGAIVYGMILVQIPNIYLGLINNYQAGEGNLNYVGWSSTIGSLIMIIGSMVLVPIFGLKGYFGAMYISTFASLVLMTYKEYYKKNTLHRKDANSMYLIIGLILVSWFFIADFPFAFRLPLTIVLILASAIIFWKYCLDVQEKEMAVFEKNKIRLSRRLTRRVD